MNELYNILIKLMNLMPQPLLETLYMVATATAFSVLLGTPLGVITAISEENHIWPHKNLNKALNLLINVTRSMPFIILMIAVFPLSKFLIGRRIGTTAAIVPLTIAAIPFVARLVETSVKELSWGIIEASLSMGASTKQIIFKVILPESLPSIVSGITLTIINLIGYSAMAGAIGGGGLGDLAIRFGYQGFQEDVLIGTVIVLLAIVQLVQFLGDRIYKGIIR